MFYRRSVLALAMVVSFLLPAPDDVEAVTGAVMRVWPDGSVTEHASMGLILPDGVAVGGDDAVSVSNSSVFPDMGEIVRVGREGTAHASSAVLRSCGEWQCAWWLA